MFNGWSTFGIGGNPNYGHALRGQSTLIFYSIREWFTKRPQALSSIENLTKVINNLSGTNFKDLDRSDDRIKVELLMECFPANFEVHE